jgi:hypothetical protein
MLYTQQVAKYGSKVGVHSAKLDYLPREYDSRKRRTLSSVYSPHAVIALVKSLGQCAGCHGQRRELINGYCEICRACGANDKD